MHPYRYGNPIEHGQHKDSNSREIRHSKRKQHALYNKVNDVFVYMIIYIIMVDMILYGFTNGLPPMALSTTSFVHSSSGGI